MRLGREAWILFVLLVIFAGSTTFYARRGFEQERRSQPSSYSTGRSGLAAAFRLMKREGFRVGRLEAPYTRLPETAGLLVVATPPVRPLSSEERISLEEWIDGGGALFLLITARPIGIEGELPIKDVEVREHDSPAADLPPSSPTSRYMRDVAQIHVTGSIRLIASGQVARPQTLVGDAHGAYAMTWKKGAGEVIAAAGGIGLANADLAGADNAVFLANIAANHARGARPVVLFDEYHQGYGEEDGSRSLWQAIGAQTRAAAWYLLVVALIVVYNANRRFGSPKQVPAPESRPSTEYIASLAGLYQRARASSVAVDLIYHAFVRDLTNLLDAPPGASAVQIAALAERRLGWKIESVGELLDRCDAISRGARSTPAEMVKLARQMHEYRRRANLA